MKKVVVTSLPKTGTSTLAVMLRILGYQVTGPDTIDRIKIAIRQNNGFQDFPWCFEYKRFDPKETKFIFIQRDDHVWSNSFINNYGKDGRHSCEFYWEDLKNVADNREALISKKRIHQKKFNKWIVDYRGECLYTNLNDLNWAELCDFLEVEIPKNVFGKVIPIPNINSTSSRKFIHQKKKIKRLFNYVIPEGRLSRLRNSIFRKTGIRF